MTLHDVLRWFSSLEWHRIIPEITGKFLAILLGVLASWYFVFRRRLKALERLRQGDSDDILFQSHYLLPTGREDQFVLAFRNLCTTTTVDRLYDNSAARQWVRTLSSKTTLANPVLQTEGTMGYELLNDAFGYIAGHLASAPFPREVWLFAMTCEDRQVVRRKCIRCFLIRPRELERFVDWQWCTEHLQCEKVWHWYRIVALHQIALQWKAEELRDAQTDHGKEKVPLVDDQAQHRRVRPMSAGINPHEIPVGQPVPIPWHDQESELKRLGLHLKVP